MKVPAELTIYIFIALAALYVCSVNLTLGATPLKMPQAMSPAGTARRSNTCTIRRRGPADSQRRVLPSTLLAIRTLQIP